MITLQWDKIFFLWHQLPADWSGLVTFMGEMIGMILITHFIVNRAPWWAVVPCCVVFIPAWWLVWDFVSLLIKIQTGLEKG